MSLGVGSFAASGGSTVALPDPVYRSKGALTNGSNSSKAIGPASADRLLIIAVRVGLQSSSHSLAGFYVNDVSRTPAFAYKSGPTILNVYVVSVPTGTTANLRYNTAFSSGCSVVVYSVTDLEDSAVFNSKVVLASTTTAASINIPANGFVIGVRITGSGVNGAYGTAWSGLTLDTTTTGGANTVDISAAHKTQIAPSTGLSISASTNYAGDMVLVSFGNGS